MKRFFNRRMSHITLWNLSSTFALAIIVGFSVGAGTATALERNSNDLMLQINPKFGRHYIVSRIDHANGTLAGHRIDFVDGLSCVIGNGLSGAFKYLHDQDLSTK